MELNISFNNTLSFDPNFSLDRDGLDNNIGNGNIINSEIFTFKDRYYIISSK